MNLAVPSRPSASSTAATVTVRAVLQSSGVNVSVFCSPAVSRSVSTVRSGSPPASFATVTVTSPLGCAASFTVYLAAVPSATVTLDGDSTIILRSSSSSVAVSVALTPP